MRHQNAYRKLTMSAAHRRAMFRNMATSLLLHEQYETSVAKAKELRPITEGLITLAKKDSLHNRRKAYSYLMSKAVVHKLFAELGPRYASRAGGYTRVLKTGHRHGDAAEMAVIQMVKEEAKAAEKAKPKKARKSRASAKAGKSETQASPEKQSEGAA
jgi:large subunit ribosomal protein L17